MRTVAVLLASTGCVTSLHVTTAGSVVDGAAAPAFMLSDQDGRMHTLAGELARGPVVLVFYRGYW